MLVQPSKYGFCNTLYSTQKDAEDVFAATVHGDDGKTTLFAFLCEYV